MRKIILCLILIISGLWAAYSTDTITFQGYLTDAGGNVVNGDKYMGFKIYSVKTGSTPILADTDYITNIRKVTVYQGNYATKIQFASSGLTKLNTATDVWVEVYVNSSTFTWASPQVDSYKLTPRIQLTATPYALKVRGITYDSTNDSIGIGTTTPGTYKLNVNGNTNLNGILTIGPNADTNLYRSAANVLKTDDTFTGTSTMEINGFGIIRNAIWNDLAEARPLAKGQKLIPGKCYVLTKKGLAISNKRAEIGTAGICSDTFGFILGGDRKDKTKAPIAVSGWVLAYVDKDYPIGTALVSGPNGILTAAKIKEKRDFPERIVGIVDTKPDKYNNVKLDGRYWIKVK